MLPAETRYHAGEQELLAVVRANMHWRHYLEGAVSLRVVTDLKRYIVTNIFETKYKSVDMSVQGIGGVEK